MDYGFTHQGTVYTPNGTTGITPADNESRNLDIERSELASWENQPATACGYYTFPAENLPLFGVPKRYRESFTPLLHSYVNADTPDSPGIAHQAIVTTWRGTTLGVITSARVYRHNFGGRMVSMRVRGTNGVMYYGRASWDNGDVIRLRKTK